MESPWRQKDETGMSEAFGLGWLLYGLGFGALGKMGRDDVWLPGQLEGIWLFCDISRQSLRSWKGGRYNQYRNWSKSCCPIPAIW